ncbi:MAG TPA: cysteine--tRNA ligase [Candidatus Brocadiia bacterium]|nr:cysteine--tRNA ligase [Candidatus Brocadiia bacterium]
MALVVTNTLTRRKEEFKPLREGFVGMYVCGPTVYGHSHIGHAKSYVSFDVIARYLRHIGYKVRYVQNITDVGHLTDDADSGEDKIAKRAKEERVEPMELVETYMRSYFEDMDALNALRPDISPRASGHIPEQIELVKTLIAKGHAYEVAGSVYFDVTSWRRYGTLSGQRLDEMEEAVRIDPNEQKRHPSDFALWKKAEPQHIMQWDSPWGRGFPGWHLECSVMSMKYIGPTLDIHGGGLENSFPHHEDEIAQSEAATGQPFARYWLHNNMVTVKGKKMGKSLRNFITLKDAFAGKFPQDEEGNPTPIRPFRPMVIRYFILTSHYRNPLDFSVEAMEAAEKGLKRLEATVGAIRKRLIEPASGEVSPGAKQMIEELKSGFTAQMDDDFNSAGAIAELFKFSAKVNESLEAGEVPQGDLKAIDAAFTELAGGVLGIITAHTGREEESSASIEKGLLDLMVETRNGLRKAKQFQLSDQIRNRLGEMGVQLEDGPEGTKWKRV